MTTKANWTISIYAIANEMDDAMIEGCRQNLTLARDNRRVHEEHGFPQLFSSDSHESRMV